MASVIMNILALVAAITGTVLCFVFIVPERRRNTLNNFGKLLHDVVNFKTLIVEKILQAFYIFATLYVIVLGFTMLFYVESGVDYYYYRTSSTWYGGYGLLMMIFGPIAIRIFYEFAMMFVLLVKNVIQINNKLKTADDGANEPTVSTAAPKATPITPRTAIVSQPNPRFCTRCGNAQSDPNSAWCTYCGNKL